jgi:predicted unusual protein kinase regulating ubiquinone biosynthesis (AarF/ABC1/UbiB family)
MAAASIGQVHRAQTKDGHDLAIKIQYPGVVESIDSDVDNVATLFRMSGLLPKEMDIKPLLRDAKRQLHDEADYLREAGYLSRYGELLADAPDYAAAAPARRADHRARAGDVGGGRRADRNPGGRAPGRARPGHDPAVRAAAA